MLNAFRRARALKNSVQGHAAGMTEQILRLGRASPVAPYQQELIRQLQGLAEAFKDTILDRDVTGERFMPAVEDAVNQVLGSIFESAAKRTEGERAAEEPGAGGHPMHIAGTSWEISPMQRHVEEKLLSRHATVSETAGRQAAVPEKEKPAGAPLNLRVKTSELVLVLQREAKARLSLGRESGPRGFAAGQTGHGTHTRQVTPLGGEMPDVSPVRRRLQDIVEKTAALPEAASGNLLSRCEKAVSLRLQELGAEINRGQRRRGRPDWLSAAHGTSPTLEPKPKDLAGTMNPSRGQVDLQTLLEKTGGASGRSPREFPGVDSGAHEKEISRFEEPQPAAPKDEVDSRDARGRTARRGAPTSMARQITSLFESGSPPAAEIALERTGENAGTFPGRSIGQGTRESGAQRTTASRGSLPEEIATAVQWLAEEEVEQRLVEILSRQAKLRGIDLS